ATKDDTIDLGVGLVLHQKVGDHVQTGDIICTVHSNEKNPASVLDIVQKNIIIGKHATPSKLIRKMIQHNDYIQCVFFITHDKLIQSLFLLSLIFNNNII